MKKTRKQATRIIANIYDIILQTKFAEQAKKEMKKDLNDKNISLDYYNNTITIENLDGTIAQYVISIK